MAQKSVANLKDSVSAILQGLNLNNVRNLHGSFERTARQVAQKIALPSAMGRENITLYDGVINYPAPTDLFGSAIVDLQPQGNSRFPTDYVYKAGIEDFDRTKGYLPNGAQVTFDSLKGVDIVKIVSTRTTPKIELDPFTATTGWTLTGSASGLTLDETVYYQAFSSLRFLLTGASTGVLTKTIPQVDLTSYVGVGVVFLAIRTPSVANLTSITIKLGSTSGLVTNYYTASATTGFLGSFTVGDWLIVAIDLATATTVGTPVPTTIKYAQISIAHVATLTNFYIGDFWIALPSPATLLYETAAVFMASGANPSQTIAGVDDLILMSDGAYAIYEQECSLAIAKQQGGTLASGVVQSIKDDLYGNGRDIVGLYQLYRTDNPTQKIATIGNYYDD